MVFFTCNHCGDSVKKPAVEKHYNTKCRGQVINVSCMDCQKDFVGDAHVAHTKCISEAEKYSAKGFVAKQPKNSNAKKQDSWIEVVRSILQSNDYQLKPRVREAFQKLEHHENVPRKQAKFENFATKCIRLPRNVVGEVWEVLEKELKKMKEANTQQNGETPGENGSAEKSSKKKKHSEEDVDEPAKKKSKKEEQIPVENGNATVEKVSKKKKTETDEVAENQTEAEEFKWQDVIVKIANKHSESGIALESLEKKTLKKYKSKLGVDKLSDKQQKQFAKKFSKHLKKCSSVKLEDNIVKIA